MVLVDDPEWVESMQRALAPLGRRVLAARGPADALRMVEDSRSSLLVVDPSACETGLDWVRAALAAADHLQVIVMTADSTAETASAAFAAGASAVISKKVRLGDLTSALALAAAQSEPGPAERAGLSERETELLELVVRGHSNAKIARALWISEQTVKFHLSRIYKKLGVSSRTEAAWVARSQRFLPRRRG